MHIYYIPNIRRFENVIDTIAGIAIAILKKSNNSIHYSPICWQCGTEQNLLKVHTNAGELFICSDCGGEF